MPPDSRRPLRILSFDGGGVRGLSSLMILREVMQRFATADDEDLSPCNYFDLICGTSTGGLIAIMLGRLNLSVDASIDEYLFLAKKVFGKDRSFSLFGKSIPLGSYRFSATNLEECIKDVLSRHDKKPDEPMFLQADKNICPTFVVAVYADAADNPSPHLFSTYNKFDKTCIWEAARATSAAPTFFKPISIGTPRVQYVDAGLGFNNPTDLAIREAHRLYPGREVGLVLSIGAGRGGVVQIGKPNGWVPFGLATRIAIAKALASLITNAERTHDGVYRQFSATTTKNVYGRLNVDRGMEMIGLEEWKKEEQMAGVTTAYLSNAQVGRELQSIVAKLRSLSTEPKMIEVSAAEFKLINEETMDTEYPGMRYWYREKIDPDTGYPEGVRVDEIFKGGRRPVGDTILSCRRIVYVLLRAKISNVPAGRYTVKWIVWYFNNQAKTLNGNSVTARKFPRSSVNLPTSDDIREPGHFPPFDLLYSVGKPRDNDAFMSVEIDVDQIPDVTPHLLKSGFCQRKVESGLWNTLKDTGWAEVASLDPVDVAEEGTLAFVVSKVFKRFWYGGFAFGGVRLEPIE